MEQPKSKAYSIQIIFERYLENQPFQGKRAELDIDQPQRKETLSSTWTFNERFASVSGGVRRTQR